MARNCCFSSSGKTWPGNDSERCVPRTSLRGSEWSGGGDGWWLRPSASGLSVCFIRFNLCTFGFCISLPAVCCTSWPTGCFTSWLRRFVGWLCRSRSCGTWRNRHCYLLRKRCGEETRAFLVYRQRRKRQPSSKRQQ